MKDESSPTNYSHSANPGQDRLQASQNELLAKIRTRQDSEKVLHQLVFRLSMLVDSTDPVLSNNLHMLRKALQQGSDLVHLHPLIKDISDQVSRQRSETGDAFQENEERFTKHVPDYLKHLYLIQDVLLVLLDKVNFPDKSSEQIEKITISLRSVTDENIGLNILASITALAGILDEHFYTIKDEKEKINLYLRKMNIDLQHLDEEIVISDSLQTEKKNAEYEINSIVETQMLEVENAISNGREIDKVKGSVQDAVNTIRSQMESFRNRSGEQDKQASSAMDRLRNQLKHMEEQYDDLKKQVLEKNEPSLSDPVTGVRNRLAYEEAIYLEVERYKRYGRPFSLLLFDLDNFKKINISAGQNVGDAILRGVAQIMAANIRSVDFLARYGGDKFILILPELGKEDARRFAIKIGKSVQAKKFEIGGIAFQTTISAGVVTIKSGDTTESLYEKVEFALYLAKEKGRNRYEVE